MDFGQALNALKAGQKVARGGWNGKDMWIAHTPGSIIDASMARSGAVLHAAQAGEQTIEILPHIDMWTTNAHGRRAVLCGWLASQTDMLSDDWVIVE